MAESGFTGAMIEQFGEISVFIIGSHDAVKFNHEVVKAWRLLLACVTDEMKVNYWFSSFLFIIFPISGWIRSDDPHKWPQKQL